MHNIYLNLRYMYECMYYIHTLLLPMSEDLPGTVPVPVKVYFIYILQYLVHASVLHILVLFTYHIDSDFFFEAWTH